MDVCIIAGGHSKKLSKSNPSICREMDFQKTHDSLSSQKPKILLKLIYSKISRLIIIFFFFFTL